MGPLIFEAYILPVICPPPGKGGKRYGVQMQGSLLIAYGSHIKKLYYSNELQGEVAQLVTEREEKEHTSRYRKTKCCCYGKFHLL